MPPYPPPPAPPWTTTGGIFARIGKLGGLLNAINLSRGTTIPSHISSIQQQFLNADQSVIDRLYSNLQSYQNSCSALNSPIRSMAQNTIIDMANDSLLLNNMSLQTAMQFIISQMISNGQTVNQCILSSNVTYNPANIGNPNLICTLYDNNGVLCEYSYSELCTATVVLDSQQSANLAGVEGVNIQSQFSINDTFSYLYPEGSQVSLNLNAVSGLVNGAGGTSQWLMNGSMETWSPTAAGLPTSWHTEVGSAGTTILQSQFPASPTYDGLSALQFAGNGSELTGIYQRFSTPAATYDTPTLIYPNSIFGINLFVSVNATPASGVLRVGLTNGVSIINDNAGNPNSFSVNLNTLTSTWVPISGTFRTPNQLPAFIALELKLTTALPSGKNLFIDRVAFTQMIRLYNGGPYVQLFSGNVPMIRGDTMWLNISNSYNGQVQWLFQKLFNMTQLRNANNTNNLILPSSLTPTISDSVIS